MPSFGNPFEGLTANRKVSDTELIRAVRFMVAAEYEAVQLYMQLAEATDNELAKAVLIDIADEERVHAGEFLRLLKALAPDEEEFYKEGEEEVEELIEALRGGKAVEEKNEESKNAAAFTVGSLIEK
ncbi:MAG TPA: rubrerythrin [Candidatus Avacidaminococcus intestinavium]|uniref:Rubrerythrin n=1 Tax=Candidatus Avacidaminococcus intestinavium TaxID=2840684 RepID=A0A9D1SLI6_9FIRM|nr:rubrerythrin [Candidatus Avacidaminococcus intestinavium]